MRMHTNFKPSTTNHIPYDIYKIYKPSTPPPAYYAFKI